MSSHHTEDSHDDTALEIVDLDPPTPHRPTSKPFVGPSRRVMRITLVTLIVLGAVVILLGQRSNLISVLRLNPTPTPTARPTAIALASTQRKSFSIQTFQNIIYISTTLYNNNGGMPDTQLEALHADTGKKFWSFPQQISGSPLLHNGIFYVSTQDSFVAIDASNQRTLWSHSPVSVELINNGILYCEDQLTNKLMALHANDGTTLWENRDISFVVQYTSDTLYGEGGNFGGIAAVRVSDGATLWRTELSINGGIIFSDNAIYISSNEQEKITALDLKDGRILWSTTKLGSVQVADENTLYSLSRADGHLYALKATDGTVLWTYDVLESAQVAVEHGIIYTTSISGVTALDANTGRELWKNAHNIAYTFSPRGALYLENTDETVIAVRPEDGSSLWSQPIPGSLPYLYSYYSLPSEDILYLMTFTKLTAVRSSDGKVLWQIQNQEIQNISEQENIVYITLTSGILEALRKSDGKVLWQNKL